jgi:hypothetical protein
MASRKRQRLVAALLGVGLIGGSPAALAAENRRSTGIDG